MERKVEVRKCRTLGEQLAGAGSTAEEAARGSARDNHSTGEVGKGLGSSRSCADRFAGDSLPRMPRSREQEKASQRVAATQEGGASKD